MKLVVIGLLIWMLPATLMAHELPRDQTCNRLLTLSGESYLPDEIKSILHLKPELEQAWRNNPNHSLWILWRQALTKRQEIETFIHAQKGPEVKTLMQVQAAIDAALTRHQMIYARSLSPHKLDVPRHLKILREIAGFEADQGLWSLYKIRRAIVGRYSLSEYFDCR